MTSDQLHIRRDDNDVCVMPALPAAVPTELLVKFTAANQEDGFGHLYPHHHWRSDEKSDKDAEMETRNRHLHMALFPPTLATANNAVPIHCSNRYNALYQLRLVLLIMCIQICQCCVALEQAAGLSLQSTTVAAAHTQRAAESRLGPQKRCWCDASRTRYSCSNCKFTTFQCLLFGLVCCMHDKQVSTAEARLPLSQISIWCRLPSLVQLLYEFASYWQGKYFNLTQGRNMVWCGKKQICSCSPGTLVGIGLRHHVIDSQFVRWGLMVTKKNDLLWLTNATGNCYECLSNRAHMFWNAACRFVKGWPISSWLPQWCQLAYIYAYMYASCKCSQRTLFMELVHFFSQSLLNNSHATGGPAVWWYCDVCVIAGWCIHG